jgi:chemotaxis protein CheX
MIVPFIKSTKNIFKMMLQLDVNVGEPSIKQSNQPSHDVSGIIAFSGDLNGSVVLSFPWDTAQRVVTLFTGMEIGADQREELADAVGELVNMIAGSAKAQFEGRDISISCPSMVLGDNHTVQAASDTVGVLIPCESDCGHFSVEVTSKAEGSSAAAAA